MDPRSTRYAKYLKKHKTPTIGIAPDRKVGNLDALSKHAMYRALEHHKLTNQGRKWRATLDNIESRYGR